MEAYGNSKSSITIRFYDSGNIDRAERYFVESIYEFENLETKDIRISDIRHDGDDYDSRDVALSGNVLSIDVSYAGGCEVHDFDLVWDERFSWQSKVKNPRPEVILYLRHDANGDLCKAYMSETLIFDLTAIKNKLLEESPSYRGDHIGINLQYNNGEIVNYKYFIKQPSLIDGMPHSDSDSFWDRFVGFFVRLFSRKSVNTLEN